MMNNGIYKISRILFDAVVFFLLPNLNNQMWAPTYTVVMPILL